ncbi:DUF5681 domain-containing protein [Devosia sp.]|jgi:hypothetical protein|uniref:DUF5681 domain-containing protein n=1 Tax=Devosia sp. TaxID=1871048 RepID=UPI0037BFC8FE
MPFQRGNKHGRGRAPAGRSLTEALRVALAQKTDDGRRVDRVIADILVAKAMQGDMQAIKEVLDRVEGKPVQMLQGAHSEFKPMVVQFAPEDIRLL